MSIKEEMRSLMAKLEEAQDYVSEVEASRQQVMTQDFESAKQEARRATTKQIELQAQLDKYRIRK